jgi:hypothetical protein
MCPACGDGVPRYSSTMGVLALDVPGKGNPPYLQILVVIVLIAAVYFATREYVNWRNGK